MFGKIGTMLGISTAASCMASSSPFTGGVEAQYGQLTHQEARAKQKARKRDKAARQARKRNRRK